MGELDRAVRVRVVVCRGAEEGGGLWRWVSLTFQILVEIHRNQAKRTCAIGGKANLSDNEGVGSESSWYSSWV